MPKQNVFRRTLNRARDTAEEGWDTAKEKFGDIEDSTERYIKKNPFKSVLIALGAGALVGAGIALGVEAAVKSRMRKQSFWEKHNPFN